MCRGVSRHRARSRYQLVRHSGVRTSTRSRSLRLSQVGQLEHRDGCPSRDTDHDSRCSAPSAGQPGSVTVPSRAIRCLPVLRVRAGPERHSESAASASTAQAAAVVSVPRSRCSKRFTSDSDVTPTEAQTRLRIGRSSQAARQSRQVAARRQVAAPGPSAAQRDSSCADFSSST